MAIIITWDEDTQEFEQWHYVGGGEFDAQFTTVKKPRHLRFANEVTKARIEQARHYIETERPGAQMVIDDDLAELGQEYAAIVLRQETGLDAFGETARPFEPGDADRLADIEAIFEAVKNFTLLQYVETLFEYQKENLK